MSRTSVVILGAGPGGLAAAYRLARRDDIDVTVIERGSAVGGSAGSFDLGAMRVDYGSHRLHSSCSPEILADLRRMLGDELAERCRHDRIRLQGRWVHLPLRMRDVLSHLPKSFLAGVAVDRVANIVRQTSGGSRPDQGTTFAAILEATRGQTICRDLYFPYARKLWGVNPESLHAEPARRWVVAGLPPKMFPKIRTAVPGLRGTRGGRFYYPRRGYGAISEAYAAAAQRGVRMKPLTSVASVETREGRVRTVWAIGPTGMEKLSAHYVLSTISIAQLARLVRPAAPEEVHKSADALKFRAMVLCYLVVKTDRFTEYGTHYFPEANIVVARLSEPKNYGAAGAPEHTVLCAELPCSIDDPIWHATDSELVEIVSAALERAELPIRFPIVEVASRRLPQAYPIYTQDYRAHFDRIDRWLNSMEGLIAFERQGLFAHTNTHDVLAMAYAVDGCLRDDGTFDRERWEERRRGFQTHMVED